MKYGEIAHLTRLFDAVVTLASGDLIRIGDSILRYISTPRATDLDAAFDAPLPLLNNEADLDATLARSSALMTLTDTHGPRLVIFMPEKTWEVPLAEENWRIGRDPANDVVIEHPNVSWHHARLERRRDVFVIHDLNSTDGTWLGAQRMEEHELQNTETIRIGPARLVFKCGFESTDVTLHEMPGRWGNRRLLGRGTGL